MVAGRRGRRCGTLALALIAARCIAAVVAVGFASHPAAAADADVSQQGLWSSLLRDSRTIGLPTRFLEIIPDGFVQFEFADLHAFAAEYHPSEHRLILNRSLSFNAAAGALKPLKALASRDLSTLFHELVHVYMDYLATVPDVNAAGASAAGFMRFAREQQECRYRVVLITPIRQRRTQTEVRVLTDRESWEALNEAWAVSAAWLLWTGRDLRVDYGKRAPKAWSTRLNKADRGGELAGYYEPEDQQERGVTAKRHLAAESRVTPAEIAGILRWIFEASPSFIETSTAAMESRRDPVPGSVPCSVHPP